MNNQKTQTLAEYLTDLVQTSGRSRADIAVLSGLDREALLDLILAGDIKLPISRVVPLAHALDRDPSHLLRRVLGEYAPDVLDAIEGVFTCPLLSQNELSLLKRFRALTGNSDANGVIMARGGQLVINIHSAS